MNRFCIQILISIVKFFSIRLWTTTRTFLKWAIKSLAFLLFLDFVHNLLWIFIKLLRWEDSFVHFKLLRGENSFVHATIQVVFCVLIQTLVSRASFYANFLWSVAVLEVKACYGANNFEFSLITFLGTAATSQLRVKESCVFNEDVAHLKSTATT